jgi:hypothetical protein
VYTEEIYNISCIAYFVHRLPHTDFPIPICASCPPPRPSIHELLLQSRVHHVCIPSISRCSLWHMFLHTFTISSAHNPCFSNASRRVRQSRLLTVSHMRRGCLFGCTATSHKPSATSPWPSTLNFFRGLCLPTHHLQHAKIGPNKLNSYQSQEASLYAFRNPSRGGLDLFTAYLEYVRLHAGSPHK